MAFKLLSSAPNLDLIKDSINRYFCGEKFKLSFLADKNYFVIYKNNTCLEHYRIIKKKNRYRFEGSTKLINDNAL
jgi:hypothetical protein